MNNDDYEDVLNNTRNTTPLGINPCRYRSYTDEGGTYYCIFKEYTVDYRECRGCTIEVE